MNLYLSKFIIFTLIYNKQEYNHKISSVNNKTYFMIIPLNIDLNRIKTFF